MSINQVILSGRLGQDAEVKEINGQNLIKFSLATSEKYTKKDGEKVENTQWHNIDYWSKSNKIAEYLKKGSQCNVIGSIEYRKHEEKHYTSIKANKIDLIFAPKTDNNISVPTGKAATTQAATEEDNLPF